MDRDEGFEEFYRTTRHRVVTVLYALGGDLSEAQDAAQEAYVRAWQRWSQIPAGRRTRLSSSTRVSPATSRF
ncbi:RNA polymerase sigma-70 factor, ECF subfamily [Micromonospora pattaloongensis]|uniref:RNA polymerase sigma-70 factor, ECF subfamily n=1 Tax=Micromonospora pattaloongensis TaxID=405436 RepID=A0A1H3HQC7_9ACTN|nr:sigma factor [Micromonospora pattaloongensis]SDY16879.1 RNA polymerase sigma-70 factor, ECF subfamily [Micromonospora pattaloongensis]